MEFLRESDWRFEVKLSATQRRFLKLVSEGGIYLYDGGIHGWQVSGNFDGLFRITTYDAVQRLGLVISSQSEKSYWRHDLSLTDAGREFLEATR